MRRIALGAAGTLAVAVLMLGFSSGAAADTASPDRQTVVPQNTAKPEINGTPRVGQTITGTNGTWTGTEPMTFAYQWIRCTEAVANCEPISGATNNTYTPVAADAGRRLILSVTATNADGSSSAQSNASDVVAPAGNSPAVTAPPAISGTTRVGQTLSSTTGTWSGTQPITFAYQWRRCDAGGGTCANIAGATSQTYVLASADQGRTIRVVVTATNSIGSSSSTSVPTAAVAPAQPAGPAGQIRLPSGAISIPATSVTPPARIVIDRVRFSPSLVTSRNGAITATFRVSDTRGFVVRGSLVFVRSVPILTSTPPEQQTGQDGTLAVQLFPRADFPLRNGYNVQFFVRARKAGDNLLAGVSTRRLVQVRTASPR
jgi:hypothetical protein